MGFCRWSNIDVLSDDKFGMWARLEVDFWWFQTHKVRKEFDWKFICLQRTEKLFPPRTKLSYENADLIYKLLKGRLYGGILKLNLPFSEKYSEYSEKKTLWIYNVKVVNLRKWNSKNLQKIYLSYSLKTNASAQRKLTVKIN